MRDPYPQINTWAIPSGVVNTTLDAVHPSTHPGVEAGVFWLGPRVAAARVDAVVIPRGDGVEERAGCWRVTPEVFGRIGSWATTSGVSLLAVCHTHGGRSPAQLSRRDRTHSIKAPGVLAIVIGHNGDEPEPGRWGWYVWQDGDYRTLTARDRSVRLRLDDGDAPSVWRADAHGVFPT
jgi:hypothetical protein